MLGQRHCLFLSTMAFSLIHSREAESLGALARGDAFFSRLEGEWWMRFIGEPQATVTADAVSAQRKSFNPIRPRQQPIAP